MTRNLAISISSSRKNALALAAVISTDMTGLSLS